MKLQLLEFYKKQKRIKLRVLVDEAYFGFTNYTAIPLIRKFNNLIVVEHFQNLLV